MLQITILSSYVLLKIVRFPFPRVRRCLWWTPHIRVTNACESTRMLGTTSMLRHVGDIA